MSRAAHRTAGPPVRRGPAVRPPPRSRRRRPLGWPVPLVLLLSLAGCASAPDTEGAARAACVDAVGGEAVEATHEPGSAFVLGVDEGGRPWTCRGAWSDGEWDVAIRPGHPVRD